MSLTDVFGPERVAEWTRDMSDSERLRFMQQVHSLRTRERIRRLVDHPAQLAKIIDPDYVITDAIRIISENVEATLRTPNANLLVTMPPQEGKSSLCAVWTPIRALQLNPNMHVALVTYASELAAEHSIRARNIIRDHGTGARDVLSGKELDDRLGISLRDDRHAGSRWQVAQGIGGMTAVGLNSGLTGRRADLIIIDDPYKNMTEADSATIRRKVVSMYESVALTRRSPGANIILIQTRWHPEDLAGWIVDEESKLAPEHRTWSVVNIPAVSEEGVPDALGREPGVAMESARGRTREEFEMIRRQVGERVWFALYGGTPAPPGGGLFVRKWFNNHRWEDELPPRVVFKVVAIDPAETGDNDEAGLVAASYLSDGTVLLTHDRSGHMTSDEWATAAVELALEIGAAEIAIETYTAQLTYPNLVKTALRNLRRLARERKTKGEPITEIERRALNSPQPFRVDGWHESGDAVSRSALLRNGVETGRVRVWQHEFAAMEEQAALWQPGQHCPDRVAAAVIADDRCRKIAGQHMELGNPAQVTRKPAHGNSHARQVAWLSRKVG